MEPVRFGKYAVLRRIASGGMADVYLCRLAGEEGFEKKVAVKAIHPRLSGDPRFRDMFAREARIAGALAHPNLVQVFDFGREGERLFLAMEYVAGWTLAQAIAQIRLKALSVPLPIWRHWTEGMLAGIGYLHSRRIVHRDISPPNVLLSRAGAVKIADYGIARIARSGAPAPSGREGRCSYTAPEQARGDEATFGSDLFAAAVVAAEMFMPGRLFPGENPDEVLAAVRGFDPARLAAGTFPHQVTGTILRGLSPRPEDRYPGAEGFSAAIRAAVQAAPGAGDLAAFWDGLFPEGDDESTVVDIRAGAGEARAVRERRGVYGPVTARRAAIGAASVLAAVTVGGALIWESTRTGRTPVGLPSTATGEALFAGARSSPPRGDSGGEAASIRRAGPTVGHAVGQPGEPAVGAEREEDRSGSSRKPQALENPRSAEARKPSAPAVRIVTDPAGVSVSAGDGIPLGRTPMLLDPSRWTGMSLLFEKEGFVRRMYRAEVLEGLSEFRLEMERETGSVPVIQANPWARVSIDGAYVGDTPLRDVVLPVGEHRLRFDNPELGAEAEWTIAVHPGKNPKVVVDLIAR